MFNLFLFAGKISWPIEPLQHTALSDSLFTAYNKSI